MNFLILSQTTQRQGGINWDLSRVHGGGRELEFRGGGVEKKGNGNISRALRIFLVLTFAQKCWLGGEAITSSKVGISVGPPVETF